MYAVLTIALCGCTNDMEELNSPEPMTRAVNSAQIVWEAQPGTIDVKQGQLHLMDKLLNNDFFNL